MQEAAGIPRLLFALSSYPRPAVGAKLLRGLGTRFLFLVSVTLRVFRRFYRRTQNLSRIRGVCAICVAAHQINCSAINHRRQRERISKAATEGGEALQGRTQQSHTNILVGRAISANISLSSRAFSLHLRAPRLTQLSRTFLYLGVPARPRPLAVPHCASFSLSLRLG